MGFSKYITIPFHAFTVVLHKLAYNNIAFQSTIRFLNINCERLWRRTENMIKSHIRQQNNVTGCSLKSTARHRSQRCPAAQTEVDQYALILVSAW